MRLGVLDVGSNTVHLLVVDAHRGGHPIPTFSEKSELRLAELLRPDGALSRRGEDRLIEAICAARESAEHYGTEDLVAFATSAVRDATNSESVLARVPAGSPASGCPAIRRGGRRWLRCASTFARRSRRWGRCWWSSVLRTGRWPHRRRSGRWPGSGPWTG